MPNSPEAWLVSVAMNLFRNTRLTGCRRLRLLAGSRGGRPRRGTRRATPDQRLPAQGTDTCERPSHRLSKRDRHAAASGGKGSSTPRSPGGLGLHEASVGTLPCSGAGTVPGAAMGDAPFNRRRTDRRAAPGPHPPGPGGDRPGDRWARRALFLADAAGGRPCSSRPASRERRSRCRHRPFGPGIVVLTKGWSEEGPKGRPRPPDRRFSGREGAGNDVAPGNALVIQFGHQTG